MAIRSYEDESGKRYYQVYVNVRSTVNPALRLQSKISKLESEKDAKREEVRLIRELERQMATKETQGSTWGAVVDSWEMFLRKGNELGYATRTDYIAALRNHAYAWTHRPASEIRTADVRELLNQLKAAGVTPTCQNRIKIIINRAFVYGIENGLIRGMDRSPAFGIKMGRIVEKKPEILTIAEIRNLLRQAERIEHKWYPIWATALLTGMRSGELFALLWTDIDWDNQVISVTKSFNKRRRETKCTKSGCWRSVPISTELKSLLKEIKARAGDRANVFPHFSDWERGYQARVLREFCIGMGLPSIKFHTLRACFATQLIRNGVPPIQIQKICGWADLKTMQRYIRLAGIEIDGATEGLKILPEADIAAKVVNIFTRET